MKLEALSTAGKLDVVTGLILVVCIVGFVCAIEISAPILAAVSAGSAVTTSVARLVATFGKHDA